MVAGTSTHRAAARLGGDEQPIVRWEMGQAPTDGAARPDSATDWIPAVAPGTVAGALHAAGRPVPADLDAGDWWYRARFEGGSVPGRERTMLALDGLATVADVYLNGQPVLSNESMFAEHRVDVTSLLAQDNALEICFRALAPRLAAPRRPRARWRTRLVSSGNLRFYRTMLMGRAPGFAPGPAVVGPWRSVRLLDAGRPAFTQLRIDTSVDGAQGIIRVDAGLERLPTGAGLPDMTVEVDGHAPETLRVSRTDAGTARGRGVVTVEEPPLWWPHTHGEPGRQRVTVSAYRDGDLIAQATRRVGFRTLAFSGDFERDGLRLEVNGVPVFARGAVWTPPDLTMPHADPAEVRRRLELVVGSGMNMLRIPGIACYESDVFYELCDELGILLWQDFMFANLDYPESDPAFMEAVEGEVRRVLERTGWRPSLTVLCGSSEAAQQAAMLGLDVDVTGGALYGELLPRLVAESGSPAAYVPSAPCGGDLPFRPDRGVANYYGVGAYLRPLEDARRAGVRFAAECLAFANVPDSHPDEPVGAAGLGPQHRDWKLGVPRDAGAGWDFEDVRDHYLALLFGVDPVRLRSTDVERYLELSRVASAEVMAEVFGEWRRAGSPCGGALVLWLADVIPGAGWGLLDHRGRPKLPMHHLRRALSPIAVWSTDEGLSGVVAHVANDGPDPLEADLRIALYRDHEVRVGEVVTPVALGPHSICEHNVEELLGYFVDLSWSYRFGPPAQDLIVLNLERATETGTDLLSQAIRLPVGRPLAPQSAERLGLSAGITPTGDRTWELRLSATRFAYGCRIGMPGFRASDDGFSLEPGHDRRVGLRAVDRGAAAPSGELTAVNLDGRLRITAEEGA
jgi:beta-mannosidase